eukprot:TRINITY_DN294_c0_g1_i3.p1 TRINITY_DN294_c0_g1~~TRINITY_DN294_c0_g1_i3.p1  ORF type:complete len:371 (-),score=105.41 TRINITY_DN294_c0_g1_i3:173-1285(-)
MDTIDITNLNRQFLFRMDDVGKSKAECAAKFINDRVEGVTVTAHHGRIQQFDAEFYKSFDIVVCGLDSLEARRWMNGMLCGLAEVDEDGNPVPGTIIPMVDGGTEVFKGHSRVIIPKITACFECTLNLFPPQTTFQMCTIASKPRIPAHCVAYASMIWWPKNWEACGFETKIDTDNPEHMQKLFEIALERAEENGIEGVTLSLTQGVVKNIIPAIASTNAIVAGATTNEVWKIMTNFAPCLNNYEVYQGKTSVVSVTSTLEKQDDCIVCGDSPVVEIEVPSTATLQDFFDMLKEDVRYHMEHPSARTDSGKTLYMRNPEFLEKQTRANLDRLVSDLMEDGTVVNVTDRALPGNYVAHLQVKLVEDEQARE